MAEKTNPVQDQMMLAMLQNGAPHALGIPAWLFREAEKMPTEQEGLVAEYRDRRGYQFSWGVVAEHHLAKEHEGDEDGCSRRPKTAPWVRIQSVRTNWCRSRLPACSTSKP